MLKNSLMLDLNSLSVQLIPSRPSYSLRRKPYSQVCMSSPITLTIMFLHLLKLCRNFWRMISLFHSVGLEQLIKMMLLKELSRQLSQWLALWCYMQPWGALKAPLLQSCDQWLWIMLPGFTAGYPSQTLAYLHHNIRHSPLSMMLVQPWAIYMFGDVLPMSLNQHCRNLESRFLGRL